MAQRDAARMRRLRTAIRYLVGEDSLARGDQTRLARHFKVSRQRVHQIVQDERKRLAERQQPQT